MRATTLLSIGSGLFISAAAATASAAGGPAWAIANIKSDVDVSPPELLSRAPSPQDLPTCDHDTCEECFGDQFERCPGNSGIILLCYNTDIKGTEKLCEVAVEGDLEEYEDVIEDIAEENGIDLDEIGNVGGSAATVVGRGALGAAVGASLVAIMVM